MKFKNLFLLFTVLMMALIFQSYKIDRVIGEEPSELSSFKVNVKDFGALGDGVNDDTDSIQRAINDTFNKGGGTVFFPRGTYIISPSLDKWINLKDNVNLEGVGASSVIKVKDNAGDYFTIFGSEKWLMVKNVNIKDLKIDQNPLGNTNVKIDAKRTDTPYWYQMSFCLYNFENIHIDNVNFDPYIGVNAIMLNGPETSKNAKVTNSSFRFERAKGESDPDYDNSAIYFSSKDHTAYGNSFYSKLSNKARGAIETHGGLSNIYGNTSEGYYTGVNIVSAKTIDPSNITVSNNSFKKASSGIQLWLYKGVPLKNVTITGNTIDLANVDHNRKSFAGIKTAGTINDTYFENILVSNNIITFQEETTNRYLYDNLVTGIGFMNPVDTRNITISNNIIKNAPLNGIMVGNKSTGEYKNINIHDNTIENAGYYGFGSNKKYQSYIYEEGKIKSNIIHNNMLINKDTGSNSVHSYYITEGDFQNILVEDNYIFNGDKNLIEILHSNVKKID